MAIPREQQESASIFLLIFIATIGYIGMWQLSSENAALKTQLQERTPQVGVIDISQPIVDDNDPRVHLKYMTWKDESGEDQRFACGEVVNNLFVADRDGHAIAATWPEFKSKSSRLSNAF